MFLIIVGASQHKPLNKMQEIALFAGISFLTCVTPGASVLYTVTSALRLGRSSFMAAPLGNVTGAIVMSLVCAAGLGALVASTPALYTAMQTVCAAMLIWLGWKNWTRPAMDLSTASRATVSHSNLSSNSRAAYFGALFIQITNPMLLVFLLSLMPPFVHPEDEYTSRMTLLIGIFCLICLLVHLGYGFIAAYASQYLKGKRFSYWINHISAVVFWFLAAGVLTVVARSIS